MADVKPHVEPESVAGDGRPCTKCGTSNPQTAGPPTEFPAPVFPAPGFPAPEQPKEGSPMLKLAGMILTVLVIAAAGFFLFGRIGGSDPMLPKTLAGVPTWDNPQVEQAIAAFRAQMDENDIEGDVAFYGTDVVPQYVLAWFRDGSGIDREAAFNEFSRGFGSTSGATIETSSLTTETREGTDYLCAPVRGAFSAGLCMWEEGDLYWFVFDFQPALGMDGTLDLAVEARTAVTE